MSGPVQSPICDGLWVFDAQGYPYCTEAGGSVVVPDSLNEFTLEQLNVEHLGLMFSAGFGGVGAVMVSALVMGALLKFIRR